MSQKDKDFTKKVKDFTSYLLFALVLAIFIHFVITLLGDIRFYEESLSTIYESHSPINDNNYNGDYVATIIDAKNVKSSIVAIIISAIGGILTFLAFIIQHRANEMHREDIKAERLISNYLKLMDIHREIINSVKIGNNLQGHSSFHFLFYELKSIYVHLIEKYPFMRQAEHTSVACYISIKIYMSGCTGKDDSKLVNGIRSKIGDKYDSIDFVQFIRELEQMNTSFVKDRVPPSCFVFAKYESKMDFPILPPLYKGNLQRLSSYFNLVLMFLRLDNIDSSPTTELYKQMFAAQFSIHESAILDIYFRYEQIEHNVNWFTNETAIELCAQRMQFPETFDIENASFCKNVN